MRWLSRLVNRNTTMNTFDYALRFCELHQRARPDATGLDLPNRNHTPGLGCTARRRFAPRMTDLPPPPALPASPHRVPPGASAGPSRPSFLKLFAASVLGTLVVLGGLAALAFLVVLGLAASASKTPAVRSGSVLVLDLSGGLPERAPAPSPLLGERKRLDLADVRAALRHAATDDRIGAVWVRTEGFSAAWATREEVRRALVAVQAAGKPVVASARGAGADEADYFVLSAADSVFLPPLGAFEFNGFVAQPEFYKRALDKLGVVPNVVRAGTFKAAVEPFTREDLSPENRAQLRALLDAQQRTFLEAVAHSRRLAPQALHRLLTEAPVLAAEDAVRNRLADATLDEAALGDRLAARLGHDELRTVSARDYAAALPARSGGDDQIAVVYASGAIVDGESGTSANPLLGGEVVGDQTFVPAMDEARENDRVRAVVLRIASPGGSVSASEAMRRAVARTAAVKPVVVSMGDYAASGGYWIATPAETIVAEPTTVTGSIGVFSLWFNASGLFEDKLGITVDTVRTSPFATLLSATSSPSAAEQALLQRYVDTTYAQFLGLVAQSRRLPVARVDSLAQGRVWAGADAQRLGLVDSLGGLDVALRIAARKAGLDEGDYTTRTLPRMRPWMEVMRGQFGVSALAGRLRGSAAPGPASAALARAAATADALDRLQRRPLAWLPLRVGGD